jgi:membrane fusion protein (multidrug efflux system)
MVVNPAGVVERREVVADQSVGNAWLVSEGLSAGDRVIVDGLQKVRPGAEVTVVEAAKP